MIHIDQSIQEKILSSVIDGFEQETALLSQLVKIPSQRGEESRAQDFMAHAYASRGYQVDRWKIDIESIKNLPGFSPVFTSYDNAFNVVGIHRSHSQHGKSLILNGHIDVVPVGLLSQWTRDPYSGDVENGWLFGRGSGDMKAGIIACLSALDALRRIGYQPAADVFLQSVVEEECTGNGALSCIQKGYRADAVIIPEPFKPMLTRAQLGPMWFQVQVEGDPQHASAAFNGGGANAIEKAIYMIESLKELEIRWNNKKIHYPHYCHHDHPIKFNLGKIIGGDWPSSVPAWCHFDMRVAVYPGESLASAKKEIEDFILEAALKDSFLATHIPKVVYHGFMAEGYILKDAEDVEDVLKQSHECVFGESLQEHASTAASDARFYGLYLDTPAIVYGPECKMPHSYDEAVNLDSVLKVTQTLALFIAGWCGLEVCKK